MSVRYKVKRGILALCRHLQTTARSHIGRSLGYDWGLSSFQSRVRLLLNILNNTLSPASKGVLVLVRHVTWINFTQGWAALTTDSFARLKIDLALRGLRVVS